MNGTDRDSAGRSLSLALLGGLSSSILSAKNWLISADDAISDVPFSALPAAVGSGKTYLLEEHAVQMIAGAFLLKPGGRSIPDGDFVGVGDAIYNTADPRWAAPRPRYSFVASAFRTPLDTSGLQMPRLVGSGREINDCARRWGGASPPRLLSGAGASRRTLEATLKRRTAVIHLAAHFLHPAGHPEEAVINLGISDGGDMLTRPDIAALKVPGSLVVMSGCSSGRARALAGGGTMGLTRAWLIAGANAVIASRWETPDDSGELFQSFYSVLGQCVRAGTGACRPDDALQRAKLAMLHSNSWRSDPKYWAAFYIVGKE